MFAIHSRARFALAIVTSTLSAASALQAQAAPQTPPAPANQSAAPTTASPAAAAPNMGRASWMADRRSFVVGDIITVLVDDYTISTAVKEDLATDTRTRGLTVNARLPASSKNVGIDSRNAADQTKRGQARRENRFQNEMSVRVVAIGANGLLQVKGTKKIDVDKAQQDIVLTGWVRAHDISVSNVVESSRIADVTLGYASPGPLGQPKQSILSKLAGALWP
jgi:flagellar L-ring protein FlgH